MSPHPTECQECGARVRERDAAFCLKCGASLTAVTTPPLDEVDRQLAALQHHPELAGLMEHRPATGRHGAKLMLPGAFFLIFAGVSLAIMFMGRSIGSDEFGRERGIDVFTIVPLIFAGIGVCGFLVVMMKASSFRRSRIDRACVAIAAKRTEVGGSGQNHIARTDYYVTLQLPGGDRREFEVPGEVSGLVTVGDVGVAYLKGGYLVEFKRVRVS